MNQSTNLNSHPVMNRYCFCFLILLLATVGCSRQTLRNETVSWHILNLDGLKLELDDPKNITQYSFYVGTGSFENGVNVTIGERGGNVTRPAFTWRITDDALEILNGTRVEFRMRLHEITRDKAMIAIDDETPRRYHIKRSVNNESAGQGRPPEKL